MGRMMTSEFNAGEVKVLGRRQFVYEGNCGLFGMPSVLYGNDRLPPGSQSVEVPRSNFSPVGQVAVVMQGAFHQQRLGCQLLDRDSLTTLIQAL